MRAEPPSIMEQVQKFIAGLTPREKPETLYHYTSARGLVGILATCSIWSTSIRFLNDSREYELALEIAEDVLSECISDAKNSFLEGVYRALQEGLRRVEGTEVYVTSFSAIGDQLSQWRGYCPVGKGYSIGVAPEALIRRTKPKHERFLAPCVYVQEQQEKRIQDVVAHVTTFAERCHTLEPDNRDRVFRESFKLFTHLLPLVAPVIKDHSFSEEKEWRVVSITDAFTERIPKVRVGRSMLIPYFEHRLAKTASSLPLKDLVVGPTPHPQLAIQSAQSLLERHGQGRIHIRNSKVPYRGW